VEMDRDLILLVIGVVVALVFAVLVGQTLCS
jgi:hypothetical protein